MKTLRWMSLLVSALLLAGCGTQGPEALEPQVGKLPQGYRIAATSVATCEILEALEVDSRHVVGVPHSDAYTIPAAYAQAASLGSPMAPDLEVLASLQVDCVLSPNSLEGELRETYRNLGVNSYFLDLKSVDGMYRSIQELGRMLGREAQAEALYQTYQQEKEALGRKAQGERPPRVLILMGLPGSYVAATQSSYVGSLVQLAGGENVYGDGDGADFLNVNVEDMLRRAPDIILRTSHAMPQQVAHMFREEFETNDIWKHFPAVQQGRVYDLDHRTSGMSATFRYREALDTLQALLYGP